MRISSDSRSSISGNSESKPPSLSWICRRHLVDWIILAVLLGILIGLQAITPFKRYVNQNEMDDLMYPLVGQYVPSILVPIISLCLPAFVFGVFFMIKGNILDLHQSLLGLLYAVVLTALLTDALKVAVGRPRPDFSARCFEGPAVYDSSGNAICNGIPSIVNEGRKSFPSGHSSWCFSGLGFLAFFLASKTSLFSSSVADRRKLYKIVICASPLAGATAVAVTRVDNYWHHPSDVVVGAIIGLFFAALCYFQLYPSLTSEQCASPFVEIASNQKPRRPQTPPDDLEGGSGGEGGMNVSGQMGGSPDRL